MPPTELADHLLNTPATQLNTHLEQNHAHLTADLLDELANRTRQTVMRSAQEALHIAHVGEQVAHHLNDPNLIARATAIKGNVLVFLNQYDQALKHFQIATHHYAALGKQEQLLQLEINQIATLRRLGRYRQVIQLAQTARAQCQAQDCPERTLALIEMNEGMAHLRLGAFDIAIDCLERGRALFALLDDEIEVARIDLSRALVLLTMGRLPQAKQLYEQSRQTLSARALDLEVARVDLNLGNLTYQQGEYQTALQQLQQARLAFQTLDLPAEVAMVDLRQSFVYRRLNLFPEMVTMAHQAEVELKRRRLRLERGSALLNQGIGQAHLAQWAQADVLLNRARRIFVECEAHQSLVIADVQRAIVAWQRGNWKRAKRIGLRLIKSPVLHQQPIWLGRLYLLLAEGYVTQNELAVAKQYVTDTVALADQIHLPLLSGRAHMLLGRIYEQENKLLEGWSAYQTATELLLGLQANLRVDELSLGFLEDKAPVFEGMTLLLHKLVHENYFSPDKLLSHLTTWQQARLPRQLGASLAKEESTRLAELRQQWHWHQHVLEGRTDVGEGFVLRGDSPAGLQQSLSQIEQEIAELMRQQGVTATTRDEVTTVNSGNPTKFAQQCQQALSTDELFVHFYITADQCHAIIITPEEIVWLSNIASARHVQRLARSWRFYLKKIGRTARPGEPHFAHPYLQQFYQALITPLEPYLATAQHLYLTTPARWHDIPFSACFDGTRYLIEQVDVTYIPSAQALLRKEHPLVRPVHKQALLLANSDSERLRQTLTETTMVSSLMDDSWQIHQLQEAEATPAGFRQHATHSDLIHIAAHALFRPDNPAFSWIQLAEHRLTVTDLTQIHLERRPLVVLSACETGRGQPRAGGLLGLARSFFVAGASALIATLWQLEDHRATQTMNDFYTTYLQNQHTPSHALGLAQRQAIEQGHHPFYWSSYIYLQN